MRRIAAIGATHLSTHVTTLIGLIAAVGVVFSSSQVGDYVLAEAVQNPAPSIQALAGGSVRGFVDLHPVMGSFSLLLRAPLVALSDVLGGDHLLGYRLGALSCFIPALIIGSWLAREIEARGRSRLEAMASSVLVVINPITLDAVRMGHPEEVLGGALAVLAVVCAARGRSMQAAVALGLAIGTKQWTLLAVLPTLLAAPAPSRRTIATVAGTVGIVLSLGAPLADWVDYREKAHVLGQTSTVSRYSAWSTVSRQADIVVPGADAPVTIHQLPRGLSREDISLLIPAACAVLVLVAARRRRWRLGEEEAMALLAISFVLRVALDSTVLLYYSAPMVLALSWSEMRRRGLPLGTALAVVFMWQLFRQVNVLPEPLDVGLFLGGCMAICAYAAAPFFRLRSVPGRIGPRGSPVIGTSGRE